jgi:hypothetical protein
MVLFLHGRSNGRSCSFVCGMAMFVILSMSTSGAVPQTVVISEDVEAMRSASDFGANRKHFRHFFTGLHFVAGSPDEAGADIISGRSWRFELGHRYKRRFSDTFSAGYETQFKRDVFYLQQDDAKLVPDTTRNDKEKLVILSAGASLYYRINFGNRGNHMGRFLDIGGFGGYLFHARLVRFNDTGEEKIRERRTGLSYPARWEYGPLVRIGAGNVVLKVTYRASDLFRSSARLPEMPRFMAGIEFGLHP